MKKHLSTAAAAMAVAATISSTAFAWTYNLSGKGACQADGTYKITWTVDNTSENEPFHITSSSNPSVVPLGDVGAHATKDYQQTVDGTKAASYNLNISGNWDSDKTVQDRSATVTLDSPCTQPGRGGSTTPTTPTSSTPVASAPVSAASAPAVVPVGAVGAGEGGASHELNTGALAGFAASVVAIALGVIRRVRTS